MGSMMKPSSEIPFKCLQSALQDMQSWQKMAKEASALLVDMANSRRLITKLCREYGDGCGLSIA